jgi:hypothetical protein
MTTRRFPPPWTAEEPDPKLVRLGHSAMSAPVSALPESGHGWDDL